MRARIQIHSSNEESFKLLHGSESADALLDF